MLEETVNISLSRYDELKAMSDYFKSDYVVGNLSFTAESKKQFWLKDEVIQEMNDHYKLNIEKYKERTRNRFTFKFWKYRIKISRIK